MHITQLVKSITLVSLLSFSSFSEAIPNCVVPSNTAIQNTALPRLQVVGNKIKTANTSPQTIVLKGFNFTNNYYMDHVVYPSAPCDYAIENDVKRIAGWKANSIRLVLRWDYFTDTNGAFSPANYKSLGYSLIDQYIKWGQKYGVYIILDLHIVPEDVDFGDNTIWSNTAARQKFLELWWNIAKHYRNNNTIAGYDVFNEPQPYNKDDWWTLAQDAVNNIRLTGDQHIVFVEAPTTTDLMFGNQPLVGKNIVYSFHSYEPYLISHKGIPDLNALPVPTDYDYPGRVLIGTAWKDWAKDGIDIGSKISTWRSQKSTLKVPDNVGAEFATFKLAVTGNTGSVWFDQMTWKLNGVTKQVWNNSAEQITSSNTPLAWGFWGNNTTGSLSKTKAYQGKNSLQVTSRSTDGFGVWVQGNGYFINPLLRIKPKDKIDVHAMVYAPNNQGLISVSVDYIKGIYRNYSKTDSIARLATVRGDMAKYLDWAKTYNVPLYVGEFGAISEAGISRINLIDDYLKVFNKEGVSWSLWGYRDVGNSNTHFSLYFNNQLDTALFPIITNALK